MAKRKDSGKLLDLPVAFGNVNIGDEVARIGITISRASLTASQADKHLCGKRLSGTIIARPAGSGPEQESLPGLDGDSRVKGLFDVKSVNLSSKHISTGLTFALASIDISELAHFAKREGMLLIDAADDLPEDDSEEEEESENGDGKKAKKDRSDKEL